MIILFIITGSVTVSKYAKILNALNKYKVKINYILTNNTNNIISSIYIEINN